VFLVSCKWGFVLMLKTSIIGSVCDQEVSYV